LKAEWRAAGVAYYVEADPQGRVVYRHVDTDEVMTREQAEQLCDERGRSPHPERSADATG
jgi:hypothetical protein